MNAVNVDANNADIIKELIKDDKNSLKKHQMIEGDRYYRGLNDILKRDFRKYYIDGIENIDYNKSNEIIANNFHKKLVDQKKNYVSAKPVTINGDEKLIELIQDLIGEEFNDTITEITKMASNKGYGTIHSFINENGEFDFVKIPSEQMIYIYDTSYEKHLIACIRYFTMKWLKGDKEVETTRAEVWDNEKVTYYQEDEEGNFNLATNYEFEDIVINPRYHWYVYNTNITGTFSGNNFSEINLKGAEPHGWGRVPFTKFRNNSEELSDLTVIKRYIDAIDIVSSGFINDLADVQLAIWVLRGYEGTDLSEFMFNLQTFKVIKLDNDSSSSAEPKTMDIPKEARESMLNWLEKKIYDIGQGVNETALSGGSITNVVIKAMYSGLDLKANDIITKMKVALSNFMYFVVQYINDRDNTNYDYKNITFTFNKSMIFNEIEILTILKDLGVRISQKTLLANVPFINDVDNELELIKEEDEQALSDMGGDIGFGDE